ncbi:hypothetical protein N7491_003016 [Penicillium cf. griseofulvum]|uniref:Siderophore biosynthesis enzyme n=1 Tax=Penicillium cf. griseofulvum TaxID=2972120 RepID=A0A9W9MRZ6_9EURO|nr:hypothetical protein N7472_002813 [Penicillium cf. griseofulvum]KAJ5440610.1 hypothetical protein N7491_003016 [Penicillium cf. griseofulvum]KAJ5448660.1 hypothetical protein N7445_003481 [Penicillium cf. griseofulvum]
MKPVALFFLGLASLTNLATARTDLEGCVSSKVIFDHYYASYLWYVPDSGEICSILDCGGGRAPPKKTQPGCPQYTGTETLTPDYLEGWGPNGKQAASTSTVASTTSSTDIVLASATRTSEASNSSSASSATQADSMITGSPSGLEAIATSLKTSTSDEATSTSAAATSSSTFNAAATPASNLAGVVGVMAAVVGAMVL